MEHGRLTERTMASKEINQGAPAFPGRIELGHEQRRTEASCAKVNDPEHGLFAVTEGGGDPRVAALVSRELALSIARELGEAFDLEMENNAQGPGSVHERVARMDALASAKLKDLFLSAVAKIRARSVLTKEFAHARMGASVAKRIDLPDGRRRLYVAHLGDARVYVLRDAHLTQLTQDDTGLVQQREAGLLTPESYREIDQAHDPSLLTPEQQQMFPLRNDVAWVTGDNVMRMTPDADLYTVLPGDRLVIVNGGVQRNLTERDMLHWLETVSDDLEAEDALQRASDDQAGAKRTRLSRAQAEDLAAVVYTI